MPESHTLNDALERIILEELRNRWSSLNWALFDERMRPPVLELSSATSFLARFVPDTRTIEVTRRLVIEHSALRRHRMGRRSRRSAGPGGSTHARPVWTRRPEMARRPRRRGR